MGCVHPVAYRETVIQNDDGENLPIMNFELQLDVPVRNDIYEYFIN